MMAGAALLSTIVCVLVTYQHAGVLAALVAAVLFPVASVAGPLFVGFVFGAWWPAALVYGTAFVGFMVYAAAQP